MYTHLKKLLLQLVPKSLVFRYEYSLRYLYYLFYQGKTYQCNLCEKELAHFVNLDNDQLCPRCGSLERTRRLWQILKTRFCYNELKILHFSPARSIYRILKNNDDYLSSDLSGDFLAQVSFDITAIDAQDSSYDLIICYHILEHVVPDVQAMQELFRVLKASGSCIIQTPFKTGTILEDASIKSPQERAQFFGQDDHVRIYSVDGLKKRLEHAGFQVEVNTFSAAANNLHGFAAKETVLICTKPQ